MYDEKSTEIEEMLASRDFEAVETCEGIVVRGKHQKETVKIVVEIKWIHENLVKQKIM